MPIIREQQEARLTISRQGGGGVVQQGDAATRPWVALAEGAARLAGQAGQVMAATTEDEAAALARNVTLDDRGNVQFEGGADVRARMSSLARQTFDRHVLQRQQSRLRTFVNEQVDRIRDEHPYDLDAFQEAIGAAAQGLAGEVPAELHGFLGDALHDAIQSTASRIGWGQANLERSHTASEWQADGFVGVNRVWELAQAGRIGEARAEIERIEQTGADLLERRIIDPMQHARIMDDLAAASGAAEVLGTISSEAWGSGAIREAQQRLLMGDDPALNALFPSDAARHQAAVRLSSIASLMESQDREDMRAIAELDAVREVAIGAARPTEENRGRLDRLIASHLGVENVDPTQWLTNPITDQAVWDQIRISGYLPRSLQGALLMVGRGNVDDPAIVANAYTMYRELSGGRGLDGVRINLAEDMPDDVTQRFQIMEAFLYGGEHDTLTAYRRAREAQASPLDHVALAHRMNESGIVQDRPVTEEDVVPRGKRWIAHQIAETMGATPTSEDVRVAWTQFSNLVGRGNLQPREAWSMVRRGLEQRMPETSAIFDPVAGRVDRSSVAPEKFFQLPSDPGFFTGEWFLGQHLGRRTWFDTWAEGELRSALGLDEDAEMRVGQDYMLQPDPRATGRPVYQVVVPDERGEPQIVFGDTGPVVLDPWPAFERAKEAAGFTERDLMRGQERRLMERQEQRQRERQVNPGATDRFDSTSHGQF
jgi:hypothetical protein